MGKCTRMDKERKRIRVIITAIGNVKPTPISECKVAGTEKGGRVER